MFHPGFAKGFVVVIREAYHQRDEAGAEYDDPVEFRHVVSVFFIKFWQVR